MSSNIVALQPREPVSAPYYIEILKGLIEAAVEGQMTFLMVDTIIDGEIRTVSVCTPIKDSDVG